MITTNLSLYNDFKVEIVYIMHNPDCKMCILGMGWYILSFDYLADLATLMIMPTWLEVS